jgi:3-mercaptopyruvate sulfurtransferase SseA
MSRADVLVDADWVQAHLRDPGVVLVEVDEDTAAYDKGPHSGGCQARLEEGPAGPGQA